MKQEPSEGHNNTLDDHSRLVKENRDLREQLNNAKADLMRCPITHLLNEKVFHRQILERISEESEAGKTFGLLIINLDHVNQLLFEYGEKTGDDVIRLAGLLLQDKSGDNETLFKLDGHVFAILCNESTMEYMENLADSIRLSFDHSNSFIQKVTVSIGVVHSSEFIELVDEPLTFQSRLIGTARLRVKLAKRAGMNTVVARSSVDAMTNVKSRILIIDPDTMFQDFLIMYLQDEGYQVVNSFDGMSALKMIDEEQPELIISEIVLPAVDGFQIRKKLMESSKQKDIPFIYVSYLKDEESIKRAADHGVIHCFQKPIYVRELINTIQYLLGDRKKSDVAK